jgi:hypothetical protein
MKYMIQEYKQDPKEVTLEMYLFYARKAGFWIGDNNIVPSFYDSDHDLSGWVVSEK